MIKSRHYYECHITCREGKDFGVFCEIASGVGWKASRFAEDHVDQMTGKWFTTMRCTDIEHAISSMRAIHQHLTLCGYEVMRYKIEDTLFDSDYGDKL